MHQEDEGALRQTFGELYKYYLKNNPQRSIGRRKHISEGPRGWDSIIANETAVGTWPVQVTVPSSTRYPSLLLNIWESMFAYKPCRHQGARNLLWVCVGCAWRVRSLLRGLLWWGVLQRDLAESTVATTSSYQARKDNNSNSFLLKESPVYTTWASILFWFLQQLCKETYVVFPLL